MDTNYEMLFTAKDKRQIMREVAKRYGLRYSITNICDEGMVSKVRLKARGDMSKFSTKYSSTINWIISEMETDTDYCDEMKMLNERYEAEREEIVKRWKTKNFKNVTKKILDQIKEP